MFRVVVKRRLRLRLPFWLKWLVKSEWWLYDVDCGFSRVSVWVEHVGLNSRHLEASAAAAAWWRYSKGPSVEQCAAMGERAWGTDVSAS